MHPIAGSLYPRHLVVALILVSALLHASWNALLRLEPDKDRGLVGAVLVGSVLAAIIAIVRWALGEVPFGSVESLAWTIGAGVFEAVYFVSLARAMDRGKLGPVYTISRGGAVLVVWPLSIALFDELVTVRSAAGSVVVVLGLVLSGLGVGGPGKGRSGAIGYAIASAIGIAGYHLSYKAALRADGNPSAVFAVSLGLAAGLSLVRLGGEGRKIWFALVKRRAPRVLAMGILCGGSFLILMEALARGGSGFVLTLRNTSVLFAALLAWVIGERPKPSELFGAAFVAAGATLMAWA